MKKTHCSINPVATVLFFSLGLYLLHMFLAVIASRGLYSDGSDFFIGVLSGNCSWCFWDDSKHIRLIVNILNQFPMSLFVALGVDSLSALRFLFSLGLFFIPAIVYVWCAWLSYRVKDFRVFVCAFIGLIAFSMPSEIFILNQAFTAAALCWLVMHYALLDLSPRWHDYVVLTVVLAVLFRAHESMLIWGAILTLAALTGIYRKGIWAVGHDNFYRYFIACGGVLHAAFVAWWQFNHPVGQQTEKYLQLIRLAMPAEMWQGNTRFTLFLLGLLIILGGIYIARWTNKDHEKSEILLWMERLVAFSAIYPLFYGFMLLFEPWHADPFREYQYRFLITFGMAAMMLLSILLRPVVVGDLFGKYKYATLVVSCCFIGATVWQMTNSFYWNTFQRVSVYSLESSDNIVVPPESVQQHLESTGLGYLYRYRWGWTWSVFGLSLHSSKYVFRVYRPEGYDEYFKLPQGENTYPFFPFVQFTQEGYFNFDLLREACNRGACD